MARRGEGSPDDLLAESGRLRRQLKYSEALAMARAAVSAARATGDSGPRLAESQLLRGQLEEGMGDLDAAESAYVAAAALPACHGVRVRALTRLVSVLRDRGAIAEADAALAAALASAEIHMPGGLEYAAAVAEQSRQLIEHGAREEAERLARRAVAMAEAAPPSAAREETLTRARSALGTALRVRGRYVEARSVLQKALASAQAALAAILMALGRHDEAEGLLRDALSCLEQAFGPENHDVVANYGNLAVIARRRGDLDEAERLYRRALEIKERMLGPEHPEVGTTLNNLAVVCRRRGLLDEAEDRTSLRLWPGSPRLQPMAAPARRRHAAATVTRCGTVTCGYLSLRWWSTRSAAGRASW